MNTDHAKIALAFLEQQVTEIPIIDLDDLREMGRKLKELRKMTSILRLTCDNETPRDARCQTLIDLGFRPEDVRYLITDAEHAAGLRPPKPNLRIIK